MSFSVPAFIALSLSSIESEPRLLTGGAAQASPPSQGRRVVKEATCILFIG
jgi:hypothetical protein